MWPWEMMKRLLPSLGHRQAQQNLPTTSWGQLYGRLQTVLRLAERCTADSLRLTETAHSLLTPPTSETLSTLLAKQSNSYKRSSGSGPIELSPSFQLKGNHS